MSVLEITNRIIQLKDRIDCYNRDIRLLNNYGYSGRVQHNCITSYYKEIKMLEELKYYKLVNECENLDQLANVILEIGNEDFGEIKGRSKGFDSQRMADNCLRLPDVPINTLTRNYGIKQQAIYILHYQRKEIEDITLGDIAEFIRDIR